MNLRNQVSAIHEVPPPRSFTFLHDACRGLEQARKVLVGAGGSIREVPRGSGGAWLLSSSLPGWRGWGGGRES